MTKSALSSGFTLIELMIVLAITGILVGILAPQMNSYGNSQKLQAEAAKLQTALRSAQSKATSGVTCNGTLPASNWYWNMTSSSQYKIAAVCNDGTAGQSVSYDLPTNIELLSLKFNTSDPDICSIPVNIKAAFGNISGAISFNSRDDVCLVTPNTNKLTITLELSDHSQTRDIIVEKGGSIYVQSP